MHPWTTCIHDYKVLEISYFIHNQSVSFESSGFQGSQEVDHSSMYHVIIAATVCTDIRSLGGYGQTEKVLHCGTYEK